MAARWDHLDWMHDHFADDVLGLGWRIRDDAEEEEPRMKFSYCMLPDYPLDDSLEMIKTADELGYHACYAVDETWHKDLWSCSPPRPTRPSASASARTSRTSSCASRR